MISSYRDFGICARFSLRERGALDPACSVMQVSVSSQGFSGKVGVEFENICCNASYRDARVRSTSATRVAPCAWQPRAVLFKDSLKQQLAVLKVAVVTGYYLRSMQWIEQK